jgi:hypothetical protein
MRICTLCKIDQPESNFHRETKNVSGLSNRCKDCKRILLQQWQRNNRQRVNKNSAKWRAKNPERAKEVNNTHYKKHADERRTKAKNKRAENPEKSRLIHFNCYWRDPPRGRAKTKKWRMNYPQAAKKYDRKQRFRRRLQRLADVINRQLLLKHAPYEDITLEEIYLRDGGICQICHKKTLPMSRKNPRSRKAPSLDHIVPVSHPDFLLIGHVRSMFD